MPVFFIKKEMLSKLPFAIFLVGSRDSPNFMSWGRYSEFSSSLTFPPGIPLKMFPED
jgi:hypothetical protein